MMASFVKRKSSVFFIEALQRILGLYFCIMSSKLLTEKEQWILQFSDGNWGVQHHLYFHSGYLNTDELFDQFLIHTAVCNRMNITDKEP